MADINEIFETCMLIGYELDKHYKERIKDWSASEECATVTKLTYDLMTAVNISVVRALDFVMQNVFSFGFNKIEDHAWDYYTRGFLAGQILGVPTEENFKKANKADALWNCDGECKYGYYQEALNEVKNKRTWTVTYAEKTYKTIKVEANSAEDAAKIIEKQGDNEVTEVHDEEGGTWGFK